MRQLNGVHVISTKSDQSEKKIDNKAAEARVGLTKNDFRWKHVGVRRLILYYKNSFRDYALLKVHKFEALYTVEDLSEKVYRREFVS